jgi:hypothetical protein
MMIILKNDDNIKIDSKKGGGRWYEAKPEAMGEWPD